MITLLRALAPPKPEKTTNVSPEADRTSPLLLFSLQQAWKAAETQRGASEPRKLWPHPGNMDYSRFDATETEHTTVLSPGAAGGLRRSVTPTNLKPRGWVAYFPAEPLPFSPSDKRCRGPELATPTSRQPQQSLPPSARCCQSQLQAPF